MQKSRYQLIPVILCLALAAIGLFMGCSASSDSGSAGAYQDNSTSSTVGIKYQFAALHGPDHPIITALRNKGVNINTISEDLYAQREALIVDGSQMTAADLSGNETVKKYLESGKGLLVINATGDHKQALVKHVGLAYGTHDTNGYFVIAVPGSGGREFAIYEHPSAVSINAADFSSDTGFTVDKAAHEAWQAAFQEEVKSTIAPKRLVKNIISQLEENRAIREGKISRDAVPQGLKSYVWRVPNDTQYWSMETAWLKSDNAGLAKPSWVYPAGKPAKGFQTGSFGHTTKISLYLDNKPENGGHNFQYLAMDFQGRSYPQEGPNSTYEAKESYGMPMDGESHNVMDNGVSGTEAKGWGWGLMKFIMAFGTAGSTEGIKPYLMLPQTENSSESYTSGSSFSVGYSRMGASANYSVSNSTTTVQTDWIVKVNSDEAKLVYSWLWCSNNPDADGSKAEHMNNINLHEFDPASSAVMQTDSVLTDTRIFTLTYGPYLISQRAYCKDWLAHYKYDSGVVLKKYRISIDFSKVLYPIPMSLTLYPASPSSVVGGNNASGTITVDENAPAGGTTVALSSSNTDWATVPATVTIPEGKASAAFTITTMPVTGNTGHVTPTIKATLNSVTISANLEIDK